MNNEIYSYSDDLSSKDNIVLGLEDMINNNITTRNNIKSPIIKKFNRLYSPIKSKQLHSTVNNTNNATNNTNNTNSNKNNNDDNLLKIDRFKYLYKTKTPSHLLSRASACAGIPGFGIKPNNGTID